MAVQGIERLPVVDERERLRGIVSRGDGYGHSCGATTPSVTRRPGTCCGGLPALPPRR
ncbi:CBS domain-containing protein [Streptomyces mirabilis]